MGSTQRLNLILYVCLADMLFGLMFLINSIWIKINIYIYQSATGVTTDN